MSRRRVVITGIGAITPLGLSMAETWAGLLAGKSGCGPITRFTESGLAVKVACEVKGFDPLQWVDGRKLKELDRYSTFGLAAGLMAAELAVWLPQHIDAMDAGLAYHLRQAGYRAIWLEVYLSLIHISEPTRPY